MKNECKTVRALLAMRPTDRSGEEQRGVEAHLGDCSECAALARAYAEQERHLRATPRARLTPSQREQLFSHIQRERKRYGMYTKLSAIAGTITAAIILLALTFGLRALFQENSPLTTSAPATYPPDANEPKRLVFADEICNDDTSLDPLTGKLTPFTLGEPDAADPAAPGQLHVPANVRFSLRWRVIAPLSADWRVFVHLKNAIGELVMQSDVAADWPDQACLENEHDPQCTVASEHEWTFPTDFPTGLYTITVGLYDPKTGMRAPVTSPTDAGSEGILGQVLVAPEPLVFAGQIRSDELAFDPLTGERIPFTLGEPNAADPQLHVPANVRFSLRWRVIAPLSADWRVFVHLKSKASELTVQSDVAVAWPDQPCLEDEYNPRCIAVSKHEWMLPANFSAGLYTITVGLYDPATGRRAMVTSPAGAGWEGTLGQVQVVSGEPTLAP